MFDRDFMIGTDDRALEKAPNVLNGVSVNIAPDVLVNAVVDRLMARVMVSDTPIRTPFVSIDCFGIRSGSVLDELVESLLAPVRDNFETYLAVSLHSTHHDSLVAMIGAALALYLTTNPCLVNLYNPLEGHRIGVLHGLPYPVAEIPSCLVGYPYRALELIGGDTLLGFNHQVHGGKPLPKGKMAVVENSTGSDGELIAA